MDSLQKSQSKEDSLFCIYIFYQVLVRKPGLNEFLAAAKYPEWAHKTVSAALLMTVAAAGS